MPNVKEKPNHEFIIHFWMMSDTSYRIVTARSCQATLDRYACPYEASNTLRRFAGTFLRRQAWLEEAQLYAHTCPVKFIHDPKLSGSSDSFNDALGAQNIWERIKKAGADMFYRVDYSEDPEEMNENPKREEEKGYVDGKGKDQLVNTSIAETGYIKNVIDVFVHGQKTEEKLNQLYTEPGEHYE